MDWTDSNKVWQMSNNLLELTNKYKQARQSAAKAKYELDVILASKMSELRQKKSNLGYDTAVIMLLEISEESKEYHKNLLRYESEYKSLERMIEAQNTQIMLAMSLVKNQPK